MKNAPAEQSLQRTAFLIRGLFAALLILELADLHSTLTAAGLQTETNPLLLWLAQWGSPRSALYFIKALDLALIGSMWRVWNARRGRFDREWLTCLTLVVLSYSTVVVNNYASR